MMIDDISIRSANWRMQKELLNVYEYYVNETALSFETVPSGGILEAEQKIF